MAAALVGVALLAAASQPWAAQAQAQAATPAQAAAVAPASAPATPVPAESPARRRVQSLADIHQELVVLQVTLQRLKSELNTTGAPQLLVADGDMLTRINAIEGEMQRLTARTEILQHRIERIVADGTRRIADLQFRLVELAGGDISKLGPTLPLGGAPATPTLPAVAPPAVSTGTELAVGEKADFDAARAALKNGDNARAATLFSAFLTDYPDSPLSTDAQYWRGEALAGNGEWSSAARAYLKSFSGAPQGAMAPRALFRLGVSLGKIGQVSEACLTLNEVGARFPAADVVAKAEIEMSRLNCK